MSGNTPSAEPNMPMSAQRSSVNQEPASLPGSMAKSPVIGSYKNPKDKAPVEDKRAVDVSATKALAEGATSEMTRDVADAEDPIEKSKSYDEILSENDISHIKATAIIDDMLTRGYYEEDIVITKTAFLTLRTRTHADYRRYLRALEMINPRYTDEQREIQMRYFIAASLVSFKGRTFEHPEAKVGNDRVVEKAFEDRLTWISAQPEMVVTLIAVKLNKFDRMIGLVMSEGVVENF